MLAFLLILFRRSLEVTFKLNRKALSVLLDLEIELLHDIKNQIGANVQRNKSSS